MFPSFDFEQVIKEIDEQQEEKIAGDINLFDYKKGEFLMENGKPKLAKSGSIEAIREYIKKLIFTEKFKFKIYENEEDPDNEYGVTFRELFGHIYTNKTFVESEIKRQLSEKLLRHPNILDLTNFSLYQKQTTFFISFTVITDTTNFIYEDVLIWV